MPAGRPKGSENKDKPYRDALRRAIARAAQDNSPRSLDRIAEQHLAVAAGGDISAIKELADRLDGRPAQAVEVSGDQTTYIVRMPSVVSDLASWDEQAKAELDRTRQTEH